MKSENRIMVIIQSFPSGGKYAAAGHGKSRTVLRVVGGAA
jgi:hypothetical protein